MPGNAKTTFIPSASIKPVSHPFLPNRRMSMRPAITGETANGISTNPFRIRLPQNSSRTNVHAMHNPKTVLMAVAATAMIKVNLS